MEHKAPGRPTEKCFQPRQQSTNKQFARLNDRFKNEQHCSNKNLVNIDCEPIKCVSIGRNTPSSSSQREAKAKVTNRVDMKTQIDSEKIIIEEEFSHGVKGIFSNPANIKVTITRVFEDRLYFGAKHPQRRFEVTRDFDTLKKYELFHPKNIATPMNDRATKPEFQSLVWRMGKKGIKCADTRSWNKIEKIYNEFGPKFYYPCPKARSLPNYSFNKKELAKKQEQAKRKFDEEKEMRKNKAMKLVAQNKKEEMERLKIVTPSCQKTSPLASLVNRYDCKQTPNSSSSNQIVVPIAGRKKIIVEEKGWKLPPPKQKVAIETKECNTISSLENESMSILPLDNFFLQGTIQENIRDKSFDQLVEMLMIACPKEDDNGDLYSGITTDEIEFLGEIKRIPLDELQMYYDIPD